MRDKHLLHMRPIQKASAMAGAFEAEIKVSRGNGEWDAKSLADMLFFAADFAAAEGDAFLIRANGSDAEKALAELCPMFERLLDESA
jgi:phosphotransferase system HPr (HPr) family protein